MRPCRALRPAAAASGRRDAAPVPLAACAGGQEAKRSVASRVRGLRAAAGAGSRAGIVVTGPGTPRVSVGRSTTTAESNGAEVVASPNFNRPRT